MTRHQLRMHYLAAICRARADRFYGLTDALVELFRIEFPNA